MDELKDMFALLKLADFDPTVIDTDLHKRVADAIQDWFIRRFDMSVNIAEKETRAFPCGCETLNRL